MNILVTGGSGFIGGHLVDRLIQVGHRVRVFDKKKPQRVDVESLEGDITSKNDITRGFEDIEVVYHLAAFSNIDLVKDNPLTTVEHNILGTAYLLDECRKRAISRFIFASSIYVHDDGGHLYTTSKLASENLCKNYYTLYGLPYTILRYGTAYGPRSRDVDVVSIFVRRAFEGQNLTIRGSGKQKRFFIYIDDLAEASLAALKPAATNRTYNILGPQPVTIKEVAKLVKEMSSARIEVEYELPREDDYSGEVLDAESAWKELGWQPKVDIREGLSRYIDWYKKTLGC